MKTKIGFWDMQGRGRKLAVSAVVAASALSLNACGGGGDDVVATSAVPAQVSQSPLSFTEYVRQLTASTGTDDLMPVDLSAVTNPPESNDTDPAILQ